MSVSLAASIGSVIDLASPGEGALVSIFVLFPAYAGIGVAVIGMIASGFGTSIYTSANQDGPDMPVKKALFTFSVIKTQLIQTQKKFRLFSIFLFSWELLDTPVPLVSDL